MNEKENGVVREFWDYVIAVFVFIFIVFCYISIHDSLTSPSIEKLDNGQVLVGE